jgi:hypothetical protein
VAIAILNAIGPEMPDERQYGMPLAGFGLVDTPAPPDGGKYRIRGTGGSLGSVTLSGNANYAVPLKAYQYLLCRWRTDGVFGGSNNVQGILRWFTPDLAADPRQLVAIGANDSDGRWRLRLRSNSGTTFATGTSLFWPEQEVAIRLEWDGQFIRCYANGNLEFEVASAVRPNQQNVHLFGFASNVTSDRYWRNVVLIDADSTDERPSAETEFRGHLPDGDGFYSDAGSEASPYDSLGTYTRWDDFAAGAADDDTSYNYFPDTAGATQTSTLTGEAPTKPIRFAVTFAWLRADAGSKTVKRPHVLRHSGTDASTDDGGTTNVYGSGRAYFTTPPAGGEWPESLAGFEAGVRHPTSGAVAVFRVSAFGLEAIAYALDPVLPDIRGEYSGGGRLEPLRRPKLPPDIVRRLQRGWTMAVVDEVLQGVQIDNPTFERLLPEVAKPAPVPPPPRARLRRVKALRLPAAKVEEDWLTPTIVLAAFRMLDGAVV